MERTLAVGFGVTSTDPVDAVVAEGVAVAVWVPESVFEGVGVAEEVVQGPDFNTKGTAKEPYSNTRYSRKSAFL